MAITIRFATADDASTIHRFICELATYEREPNAVEVTADVLAAQLRSVRPPFECLIAESDAPIGFALFFSSYSTWRGRPGVYLEDLFVVPEARGRGAGKQLLQRLAAIALERGCARIEWAVLDWNQSAIDFYRSLGADSLNDWTTFRITDAALERLGTERALNAGQK